MATRIRSFLIPFVTICIILGVATVVIAYGRGYRFDFGKRSLKATGLLVVHSDPTGAQILLDGKLYSATPATIDLPPGWYTVTITKEGFQPWSAQVKVQGEVVAHAEALLLPTNPSLAAITASGVANPVLSPDGSKLAYVIPNPTSTFINGGLQTTKPGIWVLELVDKPLGLNRDARQIAKSDAIDFSTFTLAWSPESKQVLATITNAVQKTSVSYLLDADKLNETPVLINNIKTVQTDWNDIKNQRDKEKLTTLPPELIRIATSSMKIIDFSPDETKILYEASASATIPAIINPPLIGSGSTAESRMLKVASLYVYDLKEDKNYLIGDRKTLTMPLQWLPSSRHLMVVSKDRIEILDYDGTNRRTAYAGPFWDSFAVPWASGGKIMILTNLNAAASTVNNLYAVNLR